MAIKESSDFIKEKLAKDIKSGDFRVLSKRELLALKETSKDLYYEYIALLKEYQNKIRRDDEVIPVSDPDQTFSDVDPPVTPDQEEEEEQAAALIESSFGSAIIQLTDQEFYNALKGDISNCKGELYPRPAKVPYYVRFTKTQVDEKDPGYLQAERLWQDFFGSGVRSAGDSTRVVHRNGSISYTMFILQSIDVDCTGLDPDVIEKLKKDRFFNDKFNR